VIEIPTAHAVKKNRIPEGDAHLPKKLAGFLREPSGRFRIISQNFPSLLSPRKEIPSIWPMVPVRSAQSLLSVPRIAAAQEESERFVGARLRDSVARVLPEGNPWRQLRLFVCKIPLVGGASYRRPQGLSSPLVGPRTCPGRAKRAACPCEFFLLCKATGITCGRCAPLFRAGELARAPDCMEKLVGDE